MAACAVGAARVEAASDPARRWVTVSSEHFALHTYDDGAALAPAVLGFLEEAHDGVDALLGWTPRATVHVALVDDYDWANGFASALPWPGIVLYAWPPEPESELGDYASWLRLLCFHEYTHIVHLDQAFGIPEVVNEVLGPLWSPNNALPRWATEGIATWVESTLGGGGGRVGSSYSEMHLRTRALAGASPSLSDLTGYPLEHPRAGSWYLYGGYLFDAIARARGADAVRRFANAYAERVVPYAVNAVGKEATGQTMTAWHEAVLAAARARAEATRARVDAEGRVEGVRLTRDGETQIEPRFSPDGRWLVWVRTSGHDDTELVRAPTSALARAATEPGALDAAREALTRCDGGCGAFAFVRDGARLVLGTTRYHRVVNVNGYLGVLPFAVGVEPTAVAILDETRRGHDPAVAADGRSVWFARARWGEPELARVDLRTGALLETWAPPASPGSFPRIDRPAASLDGKSLYLSIHVDGDRDLYRLDLATRGLERLTSGAAMELMPTVTADGRWLVYSSDRDGVFDVYARELATGATHRLTHVLGGALYPAVSPDGTTLVYAGWGVGGYDLYALPFAPESAPVVAEPDGRPLRTASPPRVVPVRESPYEAASTMLPRALKPDLSFDSTGVGRVAVSFLNTDASGRYTLSIGADWDLTAEQWDAYADLTVGAGFVDLGLGLGRYAYGRQSFVGDLWEDYEQEVVYLDATLSIPSPSMFAGLSFGGGYTVDLARSLAHGLMEHTPEETTPFIPYEGASGRMNLWLSFADVRQATFGISPRSGVSGFFAFNLRDPAIGSVRHAWDFTWVTHGYVPVPWLSRWDHALALRLGGGISGGDPRARTAYVVGGVPRQDLLSDLLNQAAAGAVWLRGFEPSSLGGWSFVLGTAEYRLPLVRGRAGLSTLPVFVEDLTATAFVDAGGASYDVDFPWRALHIGLGAELRVRLDLFYGMATDLRLGYARGLGPDGIDQVYLLMAGAP